MLSLFFRIRRQVPKSNSAAFPGESRCAGPTNSARAARDYRDVSSYLQIHKCPELFYNLSGAGKPRAFAPGSTQALPSGIVINTYKAAGPLQNLR